MIGATYMGKVARLSCGICPVFPVEVHHQRAGTGGGRRACDFDTMPLCVEHHRGDTGIHGLGTKAFALRYGVTEAELVAQTRRRLGITDLDVEAWRADALARALAASARAAAAARGPKPLRAAKPDRPRTVWPKRALQSRNTLARSRS